MTKYYKELLELDYKEVEPLDFYRDIFKNHLQEKGTYKDNKCCAIAVEFNNNKVKRHSITNDLNKISELLLSNNFIALSPISYIGKARRSNNARWMYALTVEIDDLRINKDGVNVGLTNLLHQFNTKHLPRPNYLITSGFGVHLYYVLDIPLKLTDNIKKSLVKFKDAITKRIWNDFISKADIQYESPYQAFRLVGGVTKAGDRTHAFKLAEAYITIEHLNTYVDPESTISMHYDSKLTLEKAKEKYPTWYENRIVNKKPRQSWTSNEKLYYWWLNKARTEIKTGHRYNALLILSVYAIKCNISYKQLETDAMSFLEYYGTLDATNNKFTIKDIRDALKAYKNKDNVKYTVNYISKLSGITIQKAKRNGRSLEQHLKVCRLIQEADNLDWRNKEGAPVKGHIVKKWQEQNPKGRKIDCIRDTGLAKNTVYKYWS
ncbi:MAG: hypothetical protein R3Y52_03250 [Psittacicella sp.]